MKKHKFNSNYKGGKKQLALNITANTISYVISVIISLVLTPVLINKLGKDAYSFYPLSTTITNTMTIVTTALNSMASRFITISLHKKDLKNANFYFSSTLFVDSIISFLLLIIMSFFIIFIDKILNIPINLLASVRVLFIFTFSSMLVNIISTVFGVATFAKNRIDLRSYREIFVSIFRLLLFILFYIILPPSLIYIGIITLAISLLNLLIQYMFTKILLPEIKLSKEFVSKKHIQQLFSSSIWVMLNSLGNTLLASITLYMLNRFYGTSESSIVSISLTIPSFMGGIISTLVGVYFPIITKIYADEDYPLLKEEIKKIQLIIGGLGCAIISVFSPISSSFFSLWVPTENNETLSLLSFINLVPYLFTSCFWVCTSVNTAMNDVKIPAIATLLIGILNVVMQLIIGILKIDYIMLPIVCSTMQTLWTGAFMPIYLAKRTKTKWYTYYIPMAKLLGVSVIIYATTYSVSEFVNINSWIKFIIFGGITGLISLSIYFVALNPQLITKIQKRITKK